MPQANGASVSIVGLTKHYGALQALRGVSLEVRPGAVHGLIGPNGSGKSTLMKCLAGTERPDAGEIRLDGELIAGRDRRSGDLGIVLTPQELTIAPRMTLVEHVVLGVEASRVGFLRNGTSAKKAMAALDEVGLRSQMHKTAGELSVADRRLLMVASSVARGGRVVILDEPTAGVPHKQRHYVLDTISTLAQRGITVLLVTHHVDEIVAACSEVTMLQDGEVRGNFAGTSINRRAIVDALLSGAPKKEEDVLPQAIATGEPLLELQDVSAEPLEGLNLSGRAGEIVGIAGIPGSGLEEAVGVISGVSRPRSGTVRAGKRLQEIRSPVAAVRAGVSFVSGNRKAQVLATRSIAFHTGLESLRGRARWGLVSDRREREVSREALDAVGVKANVDLQLRHLSGGNQQRALLAKTISANATVIVVHEPTVGVDIAARLAVRDLLRALATRGALVVVASADPEELVGLASRVICLRQGHVQAELDGPDITTAALVEATV